MMGRYQISYSEKRPGYTNRPEIHPIWRGVGFAMIILIPVVSYFASLLLIAQNEISKWVTITPDLLAKVGQKILFITIMDPYLYIKIGMTIILSLLIYVVFMLITFTAQKLFAPSRYGPTDAPPVQRKVRRRWK
jgi:hypothetical protein